LGPGDGAPPAWAGFPLPRRPRLRLRLRPWPCPGPWPWPWPGTAGPLGWPSPAGEESTASLATAGTGVAWLAPPAPGVGVSSCSLILSSAPTAGRLPPRAVSSSVWNGAARGSLRPDRVRAPPGPKVRLWRAARNPRSVSSHVCQELDDPRPVPSTRPTYVWTGQETTQSLAKKPGKRK